MDILDDFQDFSQTGGGHGAVDLGLSPYDLSELTGIREDAYANVPTTSTAESRGLFSIGMGTLEQKVSRGQGQVLVIAAARDVVVVGTAGNYILRYNYSFDSLESGGSFDYEAKIARPPSGSQIQALYLDRTATHLLIVLQHPNGFETHYLHSNWRETRALPRMKNIMVCAVGWRLLAPPPRQKGKEAMDLRVVDDPQAAITTREVLVGGKGGALFSLLVEAREKKEKFFKKIYAFEDEGIEICSLTQQVLQDGSVFVMIVTNSALYTFTGSGSLDDAFVPYSSRQAALEPFCDLHRKENASYFSLNMSFDGWPQKFSWLVDSGIHHGSLTFDQSSSEVEAVGFINKYQTWHLDSTEKAEGLGKPISLATTEYHFLLLFPQALLVVNMINGKVAQLIDFHAREVEIKGTPLGLAADATTGMVYLYTSEALMDVGSDLEDKDIWRVYLEMQDYTNALQVCQTHAQKDIVLAKHAEDAILQGDNTLAAKMFAKLRGSEPTFEDIALKFIQMEDSDALQEYLSAKLQALSNEDRAQRTMVGAWLTELHLDKINRALLEDSGEEGTMYQACVTELRTFLSKNVESLDVNTTVSLLASYGRMDDLMHYAECRQDHETLLECLMQRGDVQRALGVMRLPRVSRELVYKFAPDLMTLAPELAVEFWMRQKNPPVEPRRLLPALVPFGEAGSNKESRQQALRFVQYSIDELECQDSAIHNLAVSLHTLDEDEQPLVDFIRRSAANSLGSLLFDSKYALRLVRERNRPKACVEMLCVLGLYEDAVTLALGMDFELAKAVARSSSLEEVGLRRKLWLAIAKHVVQSPDEDGDQEEHISRAVGLLEDAEGLLKIEDILPFFPDFVTIDKFQGPIQHSLEVYNLQIENLKVQMDEATDIADALRLDVKRLESRTAVLNLEETCCHCGATLGENPRVSGLPSGGSIPPFFVFPSGLVYHGVCLCKEVMGLVSKESQEKILKLMSQLAKIHRTPNKLPQVSASTESVEALQKQLEAEVASECPRNGEIVIRMINKPFVDPEADTAQIDGWKIRL